MNTHQLLCGTRRALAIFPLLGVLLLGSNLAVAQTAAVNPPQSTVVLAADGTVAASTTTSAALTASPSVGSTESVTFAKAKIQIDSTLARDPDLGNPPVVIVNITFLKVAGVGVTSKTKYTADYRVTKIRPLAGTDVIEVTFPFTPDKPQGHVEARAGRATFNLTYDTNGVITGASGTIGTSTF
jgi:hypothetical protein